MTALYEILGVKTSATVKTIRAAYRKKAKKAHPDTGGSIEEFNALKKAHDILIDPERRLKYDATGDTSEKAIDNSLSQVIGLLTAALDNVLQQIEARGGNPTEFEIINDMKILMGGHLDELQKKCAQVTAQRKKMERLVGRFDVKKGENYFEAIVASKMSAFDSQIRQLNEQEIPIKKALDILANSSFRSDHGGGKPDHNYGSSYKIADLMNMAMYGAF